MEATQHSIETGATILAKTVPPISVSLATVYGIQVSEILLWATLIYTVLMIGHKLFTIVRDVTEQRRLAKFRETYLERRIGMRDTRTNPIERRTRIS